MRKKQLLSSLVLLMAMGIFFAACTETVQKAYYDAIPENASAIGSIKINRLLEKSDAGEKLSAYAGQYVTPEIAGKLDLFLKNGNESGLDLNENVFLFTADCEGAVAKVADLSKLKETFQILQQQGKCEALSKKNGYSRTVIGGEFACLFNEYVLLGLNIQSTAEETFATAEKLLTAQSTANISETQGFKDMVAVDSDIAWWFSFKKWGEESLAQSNPLLNGVDISQISILGTLNFENGKIGLTYKILSDDPVMKQWIAQAGNLNNSLLNYFPATTLCYAAAHINGEQICQQFEQNEAWNQALQQVNKDELVKVLSAFDGDFSWGISAFNPMGIPNVLAYAQAKNAYPVQLLALTLQQPQMGQVVEVKNKGKNAYEAKINMVGMTVYFGEKDGLLYLTNDSDSFKNLGKKVKKPLGDTPWTAGLKNAGSALLLNVEEMLASPFIQMSIYQMQGPQQGALMLQALSMFSYVEALGVNNTAYLNIYMKDKEQNSLKVLIQEGTQIAKQ